jgi:hypothetical protein
MDEADRMIDMGFEEDVRNIMSFFKASYLCLCVWEEVIDERLASTTNSTVFGNHAEKDSGFCTFIIGTSGSGECRSSWCCQSGCDSRSGICKTRSENYLSVGMFAENTATSK